MADAAVALQASRVNVLYTSRALVMGEIDGVSIAVWREKPSRATFEIQKRCLDDVVLTHRGKAGFLCVVERTSEPPDDDIRKESSTMITSRGTDLKAVALVIEGAGFRAAITRTVLSGIVLLIRTPAPIRYFETADIAASWLRGNLPGIRSDLAAEVEVLRQRFTR